MLGSTFNYIFETQLENLQNADRFYYLERLDGLNLLAQLEGNSFAELIQRNTTADGRGGGRVRAARTSCSTWRSNRWTGPGTIVDDPTTPDDERERRAASISTRMPDGTFRYSGAAHVIWNGSDDAMATASSRAKATTRCAATAATTSWKAAPATTSTSAAPATTSSSTSSATTS